MDVPHYSKNSSQLLDHRFLDDGNKFACNHCGIIITGNKDFAIHIKNHMLESPVVCTRCMKRFKNSYQLSQHLSQEHNIYMCCYCSKAFGRKRNLTRHLKTHSEEKPYICSQCPKSFTRKDAFTKHSRIHNEGNPSECNYGPKSFKQKDASNQHLKTATGVKLHNCRFCTESFSRRRRLKQHVRRSHPEEKPFACSYCSRIYKYKNNLDDHLRIHTGEKPFACNYCSKSFCLMSKLGQHMRTHMLICNYCPKSFKNIARLHKHLRLHTDEKPFRGQNTLKMDTDTHRKQKPSLIASQTHSTGERGCTFFCAECDKCFRSSWLLISHLKVCNIDVKYHISDPEASENCPK